ncbi:MAG: EamA family transporter [Candidatus Bipolaricaulota bacterium]
MRRGFANLFVVYVVWGSTYLAIRIAVRGETGFPPFTLGALRLLAAGTALLAWEALRGRRLRLSRSEVATLAAAGLLMWVGGNGLVNWAERRADSGYAALLVGALPIWMAVLEALLDRRRPTWRFVASLLVGFAGLSLLTVPRLAGAEAADAASIAALLFAPLLWAMGAALQTRRPVPASPVLATAYLHLFGALGFAIAALALGERLGRPSAGAWGALAYLTVAGSMVAFTSFVRALRALPTRVVMTYAYVNPIIAVLLGAVVLSEQVSAWTAGGTALVLAGVWGVMRSRSHRENTA